MSGSTAKSLEPARARELEAPPVELDDVPQLPSATKRVGWIAERIGAGLWHADDSATIAEAWGMSPRTVVNYATAAHYHLELVTNGTERLRRLAALRLENIAHDHESDPHARIKASELLLKLTGDLKGGRELPSMTETERDERIIASLRDPDPHTERLLRAALSEPGEGLVRVLAEFGFGVVNAEGEETE